MTGCDAYGILSKALDKRLGNEIMYQLMTLPGAQRLGTEEVINLIEVVFAQHSGSPPAGTIADLCETPAASLISPAKCRQLFESHLQLQYATEPNKLDYWSSKVAMILVELRGMQQLKVGAVIELLRLVIDVSNNRHVDMLARGLVGDFLAAVCSIPAVTDITDDVRQELRQEVAARLGDYACWPFSLRHALGADIEESDSEESESDPMALDE